MKKTISLLLALILCLSLCACGEPQSTETQPTNSQTSPTGGAQQTPSKPTESEPTEPEPTEPEPTEPEPTEPEPTEPVYSTINITLENWQDYFEIRNSIKEHKNAFDEVEHYIYEYSLCLKEEWMSKAVDGEIAVEYSFSMGECCYCIYNTETGAFEIVNDGEDASTITETAELFWFDLVNGLPFQGDKFPYNKCTMEGNIVTSGTQVFLYDIEILRIQGTITITE